MLKVLQARLQLYMNSELQITGLSTICVEGKENRRGKEAVWTEHNKLSSGHVDVGVKVGLEMLELMWDFKKVGLQICYWQSVEK